MKRKGYQPTFLCMEATKTGSPNGSGEASDVLYDDDPLVYFMLNNFRPIVNSFNGNIIAFKWLFRSKMKSCHHSDTNKKQWFATGL